MADMIRAIVRPIAGADAGEFTPALTARVRQRRARGVKTFQAKTNAQGTKELVPQCPLHRQQLYRAQGPARANRPIGRSGWTSPSASIGLRGRGVAADTLEQGA